MKKFINFLLGLLLFSSIIALSSIISIRKITSKESITTIIHTIIESNNQTLTESLLENSNTKDLIKYIDNKKLEESIGEYISDAILYNTKVSKKEPNSSKIIEVIKEGITKYNNDNKEKIDIKEAEESLEKGLQEMDLKALQNKHVVSIFKAVYSKKIFYILIAVIIISSILILINSDIKKLFFHLGMSTFISSLLIILLFLLLNGLLNSSDIPKETINIIRDLISNIKRVGIYGIITGIIFMTASVIIPAKEKELE